MGKMRDARQKIRSMLQADSWHENLETIASGGLASVGALHSLLHGGAQTMHRAAVAMGRTIAALASKEPETARNAIRNFMWHMNEDSGNIGWGIPEAFAETLAQSQMLANTYANILISYIMDLGHADNYCDNDVLRRSCYWAVGRLAQARPDLAEKARPWLLKGLQDRDSLCRGYAAWALGQLPSRLSDYPPLRKLAESGNADLCEIFDGDRMREIRVDELAAMAMTRQGASK